MNETQLNLYLKRFFAEKDLHNEEFEIEKDGIIHYISTEMMIEMIFMMDLYDKKKIVGILNQLDYKNGNIQHFMRHLAVGFIMNNG